MKQFKTYTAPQAELIEMEAQSVFCTSPAPSMSTNPAVNGGIHFTTTNGGW